ncbi:VOC family protein [Saccharomonospora sp. NPDC046836]|uniref:VOC family protein n=1 Tax=Saccharomonospora sp. NPDC046836 TaxID=3156921 RepID=UPI0033F89383
MPRPMHFEIFASDPERAITFYVTVFDWAFERWGSGSYWLISTGDGPGIDGGLAQRPGRAPGESCVPNACVLTMQVADIDSAVRTVKQAGGTIARPKNAIPRIGWHVYCRDTEGNLFGLLEDDPSAE